MTDFAGRQVETKKLKRLSRTKLSRFIRSIMDLVFTDEELATSSLTGTPGTNFTKNKFKSKYKFNVRAKPALNPPVKEAVVRM